MPKSEHIRVMMRLESPRGQEQISETALILGIENKIQGEQFMALGEGRDALAILLDAVAVDQTNQRWALKELKVPKNIEETNSRYEQKLTQEFMLLERAHHVISTAQANNPEKSYARIPTPLTMVTDQKRYWLTMEYVSGGTIYEHAFRQWLLYFYEDLAYIDPEDPGSGPLATWKIDKLREHVFADEHIAMLPPRFLDEYQKGQVIDGEQFFYGLVTQGTRLLGGKADFPFFTPKHREQLTNTINTLNQAGIYHRDLTPNNIMLDAEGNLWIIDFGRSVESKSQDSSESPYIEQGLFSDTKFTPDRLVLDKFSQLVKKAEDQALGRAIRTTRQAQTVAVK